MSDTLTRKMLVPRYLAAFRCLGPECPDTCCEGWEVPVEQESYDRLRRLPDKELAPLIRIALVRGEGKSGSENFGKLSMAANQTACALLSDEGLCRLHARCGEAVLPDICASYPRLTKTSGTAYEQFASPSCPEITRLLAAGESPLDLIEQEGSVRARMLSEGVTPGTARAQIRQFMLSTLRTDALPMWQRLSLTLAIADSLAPHESHNDDGGAERVIAQWQTAIENGQAAASLASVQRDELQHIRTAVPLIQVRAAQRMTRSKFEGLLDEAAAGLGLGQFDPAESDARVAARFAEGFLGYTRASAFMQTLERLVVNEALAKHFPFTHSGGIALNAASLAIMYLQLRLLHVGLALARQRPGTEEEDVFLAYNYFREMVHAPAYFPTCFDLLRQGGLARASQLIPLLAE